MKDQKKDTKKLVITRYVNTDCKPKVKCKEAIDLKQNCVGDYSCCGAVP